MDKSKKLGNQGEQLACEYLLEKGYEILEKNWRFKNLEIDIIAQKNNLLIAVEVKTRNSNYFIEPENAVNQNKINNILEAINQYAEQKNVEMDIRLDIIALTKNQNTFKIKHLKDAFYHF